MDYSQCALHRAITSIDEGTWVDDFDWDYVSPDGLSVRAAWEIAMKWSDEIRGHLVLQTDEADGRYAVIPNYEWIEFSFTSGGVKSVAAACASSIVWRTLAACRGFGDDEHPVFWKRLFDELQYLDAQHTVPKLSNAITDANLFFQGVVFPRFRLREVKEATPETMATSQIVRVFCGLDADTECDSIYTSMNEILARLRPYAQRLAENSSPIELSLHGFGDPNMECELNSLLACIQATQDGSMRSSSFTVTDLRLPMARKHEMTCGATIAAVPIAFHTISTIYTSDVLRSFVQRALGTRGPMLPGGVRHIQQRDRGVSTICSALPYARALETLEFARGKVYRNPLDVVDLAWLGYALFHPDAGASSWRRLLFRQIRASKSTTVTTAQVWDLMARGNNLRYIMGETATVVDKYYQATIRANSAIHAERNEDSDIIQVVTDTSLFDVCVEATEVEELGKWTCVIVPGYGAAWISSSSVMDITTRSPGRAKLLELGFRDGPIESELALEQLLLLVGGQLESLRLNHSCTLDLAHLTPRLQSLRVQCNEDSYQRLVLPPTVQTLCWCTSRSTTLAGAMLHRLPNLTSLHLMLLENPTAENITDLLVPILDGSPRLRHLCWQSENQLEVQEFYRRRHYPTYPLQRFVSRHALELIDSDRQVRRHDRVTRNSLVALLSVGKRHEDHSAVAKLDGELVKWIGGYLGRQLPRTVCVLGTHTCQRVLNPEWSHALPASTEE